MNKILIILIILGLFISGYIFIKPNIESGKVKNVETQSDISSPEKTTEETNSIVTNADNDLDNELKELDQEINIGSKDNIEEKDFAF